MAGEKSVDNVATSNETATTVVKTTLKQATLSALLIVAVHSLTTFVVASAFDVDDPWQSLWNRVVETFGDDRYKYHVYGTALITNVVYFGVGPVFMFFDLTGRPKFLRKYKIQEGTNEPLEWSRFVELMRQIVWNQILFGVLFNCLTYRLHEWRGNTSDLKTLPTIYEFLQQLVVFAVVEEVMFFYSHWALHKSRFLYANVHKKHHEWQSTVAYAAIYAHPVEHFVSNLLPAGMGPILCGSHLVTMWVWYTLVISVTLNSHCGYHFPFLPSPEAHDFHHLRFNQCFGTLGILDYLHGTDSTFRQSKAFKRHVTLTSLRSARELYPDD